MAGTAQDDITQLLSAWAAGDGAALDRLAAAVYPRLSRLASSYLRGERSSHTLDTGALVHEAFMRLLQQERVHWRDRSHFFALSATLMRRVLVDHARRTESQKRGGGIPRVMLEAWHEETPSRHPDLVALDVALHDLEAQDASIAQVVVLRYFGGLTRDEVAQVLDISESTVARRWRLARAWLFDYLGGGDER